jgi:hypothetical protein
MGSASAAHERRQRWHFEGSIGGEGEAFPIGKEETRKGEKEELSLSRPQKKKEKEHLISAEDNG